MSENLNHFKHLELIEGSSAATLTLKLKAIPIAFHYLHAWSDGDRHYAHINAARPLPPAVLKKLEKIK